MLDLVHETLDQVALTVTPMVILALRFAVGFRRNDRYSLLSQYKLNKVVGIIASVSQYILKGISFQQSRRLRNVVTLPASQAQPQRITQAIHTHMDFGTEATP